MAGRGGHADDLTAFAALAAELASIEVRSFDDAELIEALATLERTKAACAAAQVRLTERFVDSQAEAAGRLRAEAQSCSDAGDFDGWVLARDRARVLELEPDAPAARDSQRASRSARRVMLSRTGVSAQVGLARHESPSRGARLANAAVSLVRHLPHTLAALSVGAVNERRAELVVRATSHLDPTLRTRVDAEVVGAHLDPDDPTAGVGSWGDRELERRVRACADRLDAQAAVERCRLAEAERRVSIRPVPDAMALVSAWLPVAQAVAVHAALSRAALSAKAAGDDRCKGQVMADTLVELVTGQARADAVPVEVQLVMTDRALIEGDDTPAHVPGYGPVPAGLARGLVARDQGAAPSTAAVAAAGRTAGGLPDPAESGPPEEVRVWLRRLFTHPSTGTLVAMDSGRRLFPAGLRRFVVARDGTCRTPWCDAAIAHADHVAPYAEGGTTSAANGQGLCVRCNLVKEAPGWQSEVVHPGPLMRDGTPREQRDCVASHAVPSAGRLPHTVRSTTPTGHSFLSTAPPVLQGVTPTAHAPAARPRRVAPRIAVMGNGIRLELYQRHDVEVELAEAG